MITPDLAATLILIAAPIVSAVVGVGIGMWARRIQTQRWVKRWSDAVQRERNMSDAYAGLHGINAMLTERILAFKADEAKRLAPLQAANRKRHDEAVARKGK
jgi:hypothetical protein